MSEKYISAVAFKKLFECDKETVEAAFEKYAQKYNLDDAGKAGARYIFFGVTDLINESIDSIPAANVEPVVRGEWKDRCVRDWVCSLCGCEIQKVRFYDGYRYTSLPDFCPDCGAVMTEAGLKKIAERSGSGE